MYYDLMCVFPQVAVINLELPRPLLGKVAQEQPWRLKLFFLTNTPRRGCLSFHGVEKLGIGLGGFEFVVQKLHGCQFIHVVYDLTNDPHFL